jgi:HD-GYP domain-containing protein (c-di-GMP phosphodiesterase class II)
MASSAPIETATAGFLDAALYELDGAAGIPRLTRSSLLSPLSAAFDLAEGRTPGHAQRVAYIGLALADALGVEPASRSDVFYAGLLHDSGMAAIGVSTTMSDAARRRFLVGEAFDAPEPPRVGGWGDVIRALTVHCDKGAQFARDLGFSENVASAVARHHDCWDGSGPTGGGSEGAIPLAARILAAADRLECIIDSEPSPLVVRKKGPQLVREMGGSEVDPEIASTLALLAGRDSFWLGFYDRDLASTLSAHDWHGELNSAQLLSMLGAVSDVVDARNSRELGRGRRVSEMAAKVALGCGLPERRAELVRLAALLQDIGTLGIPAHVLSKPDILTLDEMMLMQKHPSLARNIVGEVPGMGAVAWWVGCHHERVDGKGYPGMLEGDAVPIEAQIIGLCEAYEALTSNRPYRRALARDDAAEVLRGLAESRFDGTVIKCLEAALH